MSELVHTCHENGKTKYKGRLVDGEPHGIHRQWYSNGVLATETPYNHGTIDGIVKQWNEKGALIAKSRLKKGTGVLRTLYPEQGLDGEMTYVDGSLTGRQLCFCGGDLIAVVYWLENKKVTRRHYLEACKKNIKLPRYDDDQKPRISPRHTSKKTPLDKRRDRGTDADELALNLLHGRGVHEALSWLRESRQPSRSVGELLGQDESIRLIQKLYRLGAVSVHAVEIDGGPTEHQNTGRLVVELPRKQEQRAKLLKACGALRAKLGSIPSQTKASDTRS